MHTYDKCALNMYIHCFDYSYFFLIIQMSDKIEKLVIHISNRKGIKFKLWLIIYGTGQDEILNSKVLKPLIQAIKKFNNYFIYR